MSVTEDKSRQVGRHKTLRITYAEYKSGSFPTCKPINLSPRTASPTSAIAIRRLAESFKGIPVHNRIPVRMRVMEQRLERPTKVPVDVDQRRNISQCVENLRREI